MWFSESAQRLRRVVYLISEYLNLVGIGFLVLMMFLTATDVIGRYLFNAPITGSFEITEFMMALTVGLGLAYTQVKKGHIKIEVIIERLPKRVQAVTNGITCLLFLALSAIMSWQLILYAEGLRGGEMTSTALYVPIFPFVYLMGFGGIILCLVLVVNLLECLAEVTKDKRWQGYVGSLFLIVLIVFLCSVPVWGQAFLFKLNPVTAGLAGMGLLIVIMFSGLPVAMVMAFVGLIGIAYLSGINAALTSFGTTTYSSVASYSFSVVPLFVLMGAFCFRSGISTELFKMAYAWFGSLPGGLAIATIGASAAFAAVSGTTVAAVATIGTVALPELRRYRYDDALSTGAIAAGGCLAIMIPPSIILVIYGILTEQPIGKLLIAGLIPGIIEALLFMIVILGMCIQNRRLGPPGPKTTFRDKIFSLKNIWAVLLLFVIVMGGLYLGVFTPTEAAGVGAFGSFVIALVRRQLTWTGFKDSLLETGEITAMCFLILIGANILGYFFNISRLTTEMGTWVLNLAIDRNLVMGVIVLIYLFLGCIMSALPMIVLTIPIFFPIAIALDFNPIWFGIMIVLVVEMGGITPPVGLNVFVMHGIAKDVPMYTIFRGIVPFLIVELIIVVLIMVFPQICTFLPDMMKG